jgi:hypothetical protein
MSLMSDVQFTMLELKLDWKQYCCWVYDLNAINLKWHTNQPKLMQLWHKNYTQLVPGLEQVDKLFMDKTIVRSKQNAIKSHLHNTRLNLKTLDALMQVSLCGLEGDAMDWAAIFEHARPNDTYAQL